MNINQFPKPSFVEITGGGVTTSIVTGATGARPVPSDIGFHQLYVDVMDADGARIGMWSGADRSEAFNQANLLAVDFGGKVRDLTGGAHV